MACERITRKFKGGFVSEEGSLIEPHSSGHCVAIFFAEIIGTFILLFVGCLGTELIPEQYFKDSSLLIIPIVFGMGAMIAIQIVGHISDAHINPSISLCALLLGRIRVAVFFIYFAGQVVGGLAGIGVLKAITPNAWNDTSAYGCCERCVTLPHPSMMDWQAFLAEFLISGILIMVICGIWDKRNVSDNAAPIKFGFTVMTLIMAMGPFTGGSMNSIRSFAPAVWELNFKKHWIYWVGPLGGSFVATLIYKFFLTKDYGNVTYVYGRRSTTFNLDDIVTGVRDAVKEEDRPGRVT